MRERTTATAVAAAMLCASLFADIPESVDVLVLGGTVRGVSAAVAAKEAGANVYLVAPRPYLGEDIAGKLRLKKPAGELGPICSAIYDPKGHEGSYAFGDTTPVQAKKALDRALLDAGVPFITWTIGAEILKDAQGRDSGAVAVNRNGARTIRAKAVIDARDRIEALEKGEYPFVRYIISGEAPKSERVKATAVSDAIEIKEGSRGPFQSKNQPKEIAARLWKCEMTLPMSDGSARSLAAAEQLARDLTWTPTQIDSADSLVFGDDVYDASAEERAGRELGLKAAESAKGAAIPQPIDAAELPVIAECDVFVAGAGTGGAPAAIAAARDGAKTIVAEYLPRMGGTMTDGLIGLYCYGLKIGFTAELDKGVHDFGAIYGQSKAEWMRAEARKAGAEIWFGALVCGVRKEGDALVAVEVAFQDGTRGLVKTRAAVDATGNADLAAFAGEETEFIDATELSLQGAGSTPKILGTSYQNTDYAFVDDTDAEDLCHFTLRARQNFGSYVWDQSQNVNSRERRRLHGVYYVTAQDIMNNRTYPDVISLARSNFDTHGQTVSDEFFIEAPHAKDALKVNIPFRALLPKMTDGLLVTGLGMSAHRDAMPVLRMQPDVQNQGYAAGLAAAQSVKDQVRLRDIDIYALQRKLVVLGIIGEDAIGMKDNFPLADSEIADSVKTLANGYEGLSKVLSDTKRALPLLRTAYAAAVEPDAKLVYAHVLGLLGDATGRKTLEDKIASAESWDKGWNYKGMDQFGRSVSLLDSYIIALGRCGAETSFAAIDSLARKLGGKSEYSHFRAVALALERLGDRRGAETLAALLALKGVAGHAFAPGDVAHNVPGYDKFATRNLGLGDMERSDCLRELCIARALYNLGDRGGKGAQVLCAYAADPRKAYANHARQVLKSDPCSYVDPFVGTAGFGHTTPAACVPFGLVQAGPDTGNGDWDHCSGYNYADKSVLGFSQTHLNGTGCSDLGDVKLLPFVSDTVPESLVIDKSGEVARPGYYAVTLEGGVRVEATASEHCAVYRITYPDGARKRLVVDPRWCIAGVNPPSARIKSCDVSLNGRTGLSGNVSCDNWVNRSYAFKMEFSRHFSSESGLVFDFDLKDGEPLVVKVALSALGDVAAADRNMRLEVPGFDFTTVEASAREKWSQALSCVQIEGDDAQKRNFYTSLYHLFFQPNNLAEVGCKPFYSTLSTWDTFRAAHPLYTILMPERAAAFVDSMLEQGRRTGYLPIWTLWGRDNQCMIGTHSIPVIVDWFLKECKNVKMCNCENMELWKYGNEGVIGTNTNVSASLRLCVKNKTEYWESAYTQIKETLTKRHDGRKKERWDLYDKYGYYPFDEIKGESVSRTMECAYDDWCAGMMAEGLGFKDDAEFFFKRAENWRNVFDPSIGLVRGKDTKGNWREPYNPYALGHGADLANDFTEGNAFQYTWHVMQNPQGLVDAMGGREAFVRKLDSLFLQPDTVEGSGCVVDVTGLIGQYVHGNEPSHHVIYFYPQVGHPEKAAERIREVFDKFYIPKPDGLCGNDDCGQMSAWYIFSAMGFYPFNPCGGEYIIGAPQVACAKLKVESGEFKVVARNLSRENKYVKSVTLNGKPITDWKIRHSDIMRGGELVFEMTAGR